MIDRLRKLKRKWFGFGGGISDYEHIGDRPSHLGEPEDLEDLFWNFEGPGIYKWHHYLPIYHRYFEKYRSTNVKMLEIGVAKGGSLKLWRDYFGAEAKIFGIDILPECERHDGVYGQVRIGSQADEKFLTSVADEMGEIDIVLDDGSHDSHHIRKSFQVLFPRLKNGGVYIIEDLHAAYWNTYSGGYRRKSSFIEDIKTMIDDMHHWYHPHGQKISVAASQTYAIHIFDSIVLIEKMPIVTPKYSWRGEK